MRPTGGRWHSTPRLGEAHYNLGNALHALGDLEGALAAYGSGLRLSRAPGAATSTNPDTFRRTTSVKLRHDIEQITYLMRQGLLPEDFEHTVAAYREALTELEPQFAQHYMADIPPALAAKLAPTYNRLIHYRATPALDRRHPLPRRLGESPHQHYHALRNPGQIVSMAVRTTLSCKH